jgi:hypothetical protein
MSQVFVTVNGKRIVADIQDYSEKEGWVDIILPELSNLQTVDIEVPGIPDPSVAPKFNTRVKRLTGEVKLVQR